MEDLGSIKEGGERLYKADMRGGCSEARGVDEWRPFQKRKWLLPIPNEHRTRDIWNTVRRPGS